MSNFLPWLLQLTLCSASRPAHYFYFAFLYLKTFYFATCVPFLHLGPNDALLTAIHSDLSWTQHTQTQSTKQSILRELCSTHMRNSYNYRVYSEPFHHCQHNGHPASLQGFVADVTTCSNSSLHFQSGSDCQLLLHLLTGNSTLHHPNNIRGDGHLWRFLLNISNSKCITTIALISRMLSAWFGEDQGDGPICLSQRFNFSSSCWNRSPLFELSLWSAFY